MKKKKIVFTGLVLLLAVVAVTFKYWDYVTNPWTRDGQVRAQTVQIAPRVSGPIIALPILDNQFVKTGQILFKIDPRTFQATLDQANADLDRAKANLAVSVDVLNRDLSINKREPGTIPAKTIVNKENQVRAAKAEIQVVEAEIENARLNLEFTTVKAPCRWVHHQSEFTNRDSSGGESTHASTCGCEQLLGGWVFQGKHYRQHESRRSSLCHTYDLP